MATFGAKPNKMKKKKTAALLAAALIAATASLYLVWQKKQQRQGNMPPADAPQLDLDNPGDQSSFPASPTGERDLG